MERKVYKVKLENAEIWVFKISSDAILVEKRKDEWKAYIVVSDDMMEEIDMRLVPFLRWMVEMWEERKELERMLSDV